MILENKDTGNVARICLYYAYKSSTGKELNNTAIDRNYDVLIDALENMNQLELSNTIMTIKNKVSSSSNDDKAVNGVEYGTMNGSKNSYGTLNGIYLMFGTTMDSLN